MSTVVSQLEVVINGDTYQLERAMQRADNSVNDFSRSATSNIAQMASRASGALLGMGAAVIGTSTTLAMEWESAWTNVEKTVSGSEAQLSELENALRDMATDEVLGSMETAHMTLAAIAASAGALGVETGAIDEFTASVAALSIAADDVSAEEIATAAAQFGNVTGMDIASEIDNWANAIARLGNEGATTEGQIVAFSNRMATLATVGFDETEILAYSAALASLGVTAELGGNNFTKSVSDMVAAVATGAPELQGFSNIAGMTVAQFRELATNNPEQAFNSFIEGLSNLDASEQIVQLERLNITSEEQRRVLMTLAAGYDTVQASILTSKQAWYDGNDAMEEAARKADTTQGAIDRLGNVAREAAIDIGDNFTPGIETMAMGLADLIEGDWVTGLNQLGEGARGLVDGFLQLFSLDLSMLEGWGLFFDNFELMMGRGFESLFGIAAGSSEGVLAGVDIFADNIMRGFERFFLEMQMGIVEWVMSAREAILNVTGGNIDIAPEMTVDLSNLSLRANQMDLADSLTTALSHQVGSGGLDLATLFFQDALGRTINLDEYMQDVQLTLNPDQMIENLASGFGEQGRQTIAQAIEMAISQGDEGALEVLTPLANELEIDIAQIQADMQAAMAAQSFPVTVTADMTIMPGSMTLPGGMIGPVPPPSGGGAGTPPGTTNGGGTTIINSYGQNPWQMSNLISNTTADSGVR